MPVSKLKSNPVAALELMVDLYLDPEIASPRKVSVWYAFWGEASSRQEYYDICGQKDEGFAVLVRELIGRLIEDTAQSQLDPDGIALGLIGVLEMLWQDFAFRSEEDIDRAAAKRRCMAYLSRSSRVNSPRRATRRGVAAGGAAPAWWVYANARLFAGERESAVPGILESSPVTKHAFLHARGLSSAWISAVERALLMRDRTGSAGASQ